MKRISTMKQNFKQNLLSFSVLLMIVPECDVDASQLALTLPEENKQMFNHERHRHSGCRLRETCAGISVAPQRGDGVAMARNHGDGLVAMTSGMAGD